MKNVTYYILILANNFEMSSYQVDVLCPVPVKITKSSSVLAICIVIRLLQYSDPKVIVDVKIDICNCKEKFVCSLSPLSWYLAYFIKIHNLNTYDTLYIRHTTVRFNIFSYFN